MDLQLINTCYETTSSIRSLALYSHLLPALSIVMLGGFVLRFSHTQLKAKIFFLFTIILAAWLLTDLTLWHSDDQYWFAMFWSFLDFLAIIFYLLLSIFIYLDFFNKKNLPLWVILGFFTIILIPFLLTISGLSMEYLDEANCEMSVNSLLTSLNLYTAWFSVGLIILMTAIKLIGNKFNKRELIRILILTFSSSIFIIIVSGAEQIANATGVFEIILYSLFSLPIFILILTYSIIEQQTLDTKVSTLVYARLLFGIFILVASFSLFLSDDYYELLTFGVNTIVTFGFGLLLFRSAKKEMLQREQIEKLALGLEKANSRLRELDKQKSEFVSIASHQLRSPLAAIRGYASMILEGSFGQAEDKMKEPLSRIAESAKLMNESVEDFLSVSRIEGGNMKYEKSNFNLPELAEAITTELRHEGFKKGLLLLFKSDLKTEGVVFADKGKTQQILHNLINNALKYTTKGTITVYVHDQPQSKKMIVDIIDTGIGMDQETVESLFEKFRRAKGANEVNIKGTGLGLFVAREMARAMHGDVIAHSDGEGKGSRFEFYLPLAE